MIGKAEAFGRFIHGMILTDDSSHTTAKPGTFIAHDKTASFIVKMDPDTEQNWGGPQLVRVTIELMP